MLAMTKRKPKSDYDSDLPRRSVAEISSRFEGEVGHQHYPRGVEFFGKKITGEATLNAIVLHFLDLPREEKDRIVDVYVKKFEAMVSLQKEKPAEGMAGDEGHRVEAYDIEEQPDRPSNSGKKPKRA